VQGLKVVGLQFRLCSKVLPFLCPAFIAPLAFQFCMAQEKGSLPVGIGANRKDRLSCQTGAELSLQRIRVNSVYIKRLCFPVLQGYKVRQ
jgi:hypothetical protein